MISRPKYIPLELTRLVYDQIIGAVSSHFIVLLPKGSDGVCSVYRLSDFIMPSHTIFGIDFARKKIRNP